MTNWARKPYPTSADVAGWTGYNSGGGTTQSVGPELNGTRGTWRMTVGSSGTIAYAATLGYEYQGTGISLPGGVSVTPSIYVRASKSGTYQLTCQYFAVTTDLGGCTGTAQIAVPANTWTRLTASEQMTPTSADRMNIRAQYLSGTSWAPGDWFETTMVSTATGGYADGNSPNWVWNGSVNASTSTGPSL